jgi:hypothetical protein
MSLTVLKEARAVSVIQAFRAVFSAMLILSVSCAYSFLGTLPGNVQSVQIRQFRSSISEYGLEQEITDIITEAIVRDGRLSINNENPDARIEGTVSYFNRTAVTYTGSEEVEQYKLEIRVTVNMDNTADNEYIIQNETMDEWILYDPSSETFDSARERLLEKVSGQIVRRCLSGW